MGIGFPDAVRCFAVEQAALGRGVAGRFSIARFGTTRRNGRTGGGGDGDGVVDEGYRCVDAGDCGPKGCHIRVLREIIILVPN